MLLAVLLALAGPNDRSVTPGIQRIAEGAEAADGCELLPSGNEVLIEKPGVCLVYYRHEVIALSTEKPQRASKPKDCPTVRDAACYAKWRAAVEPGDKLIFELEGLQAEIAAAQEELSKAGLGRLHVRISPYGVKLEGVRDESERRHALRALWPAILGPLLLDTSR